MTDLNIKKKVGVNRVKQNKKKSRQETFGRDSTHHLCWNRSVEPSSSRIGSSLYIGWQRVEYCVCTLSHSLSPPFVVSTVCLLDRNSVSPPPPRLNCGILARQHGPAVDRSVRDVRIERLSLLLFLANTIAEKCRRTIIIQRVFPLFLLSFYFRCLFVFFSSENVPFSFFISLFDDCVKCRYSNWAWHM